MNAYLVRLRGNAELVGLFISPTEDMLPEFVDDGRTGYIFHIGDVDKLTADLLTLANDPTRRRSFGAAGRERVLENYSIDRCCARIEEVYREVLAAR